MTRGLPVLALLWTGSLGAQESVEPSRHLELGHPAYDYLSRLRGRGYLPSLNPLVQPYRRLEVARALASLHDDSLSGRVREWVVQLREEFATDLEGLGQPAGAVRGGLTVAAGARGSTSRRLDALRPISTGGVWPRAWVGVWGEMGPLAVHSAVLGDLYLKKDPDGRAPHLGKGGLSDETYVSLSSRFGSIILGRFGRNWAPAGTRGLLLSDNPLHYPQLGFELRFDRFRVSSFTAELDTLAGAKRYLAAHRLDYTTPHFGLAVLESLLYGGPGAGPALSFLNPLAILFFDHEAPPADNLTQNLYVGVQAWYARNALELYFEGLLDDIDVRGVGGDRAPTRYAFTARARVNGLASRLDLGAEYQQVAAFTYRSFVPGDQYHYLGRGMGEHFADYDLLAVFADVYAPVRGLRLTPTIQHLRQGEGDFRAPWPPADVFYASPSLFLGVVETTVRLALRGRMQPSRAVWVDWDLGQNFVRNGGHVVGPATSKFTATGTLGVRLELGTKSR